MFGTQHLMKMLFVILALSLWGCAPSNDVPSIDESGNETAHEVDPAERDSLTKRLILSQAMNLRYEKAGVLESKVELPEGTQIEVPKDYEVKHLDFRNSKGELERSSTGFLYPIKVISVAPQYAARFPQSKIDKINQTAGGLFIFASIVGSIEGSEGNFAVITGTSPGAGFLKHYSRIGKPKFSYTKSVMKRFGARLNKPVPSDSLSAAKKQKWEKIFSELQKATQRTVATSKSYLMMEKSAAIKWSISYEKNGLISPSGAWTIATQATAVRHGFPNVPCAEFQSELLRQAYQRAGYRVTEDFSRAKGNELIWSNTAAVVNFSMALYKAGWVPWDSTLFRPIQGAFLMNGSGLTPGHTYISAGDDGMIVVDNGAPQGRDLRKTTDKTLSIMYRTGVFFLPPGITPPVW